MRVTQICSDLNLMVITEMVSSADDIARGVLSGGGLAAGLVAISSKNLKPKYSSSLLLHQKKASDDLFEVVENHRM